MVIPENYKKVLAQFVEKNQGQDVTVFAILKMDELLDRWSIVVAVDWLDEESRKRLFSSFIMALQSHLAPEELNEIATVVFYRPEEHLMQLFLDTFKEGQHIKEDARVNGNVIHEGYILVLKKHRSKGDV